MNDKPWETELYSVSPHNYSPEVRRLHNFRDPFVILDATLAKMDHVEGSRLYAVEDYVEIAGLLGDAGVQEMVIHTGIYPGTPKEDRIWEGLKAVGKMSSRPKLRVFDIMPAMGTYQERIDKLADTGTIGILFVEALSGLPPLRYLGPENQAEVEERRRELPKVFAYAREKGLQVGMGTPPQALRDDIETVTEQLNFFIDCGAQNFELSDSMGYTNPDSIRYVVSKLRQGLKEDVTIFYHNHDVFGMSTAQAISAASAGAVPTASVNGVADRGLACLEEIVAALELMYGVRTGIDLKKLPQLSQTVERITGIPNLPYKAITGERLSMPEYPKRYTAILQGKTLTETRESPFEMELIGREQQLGMFYAVLSDETVKALLEYLSLPSGDTTVRDVYKALKQKLDSLENKFPVLLNQPEVERICRQVVNG